MPMIIQLIEEISAAAFFVQWLWRSAVPDQYQPQQL
jgi:hypothetical protein